MADTDFHTISKPQNPPPQLPLNPTKFYTQFIYKAIMVSAFLLLLPFLPSQAPDFFNDTLTTRIWELLQLLFVGIAVSYGLFSKRNDETEKESHGSKFENAQSYVAGLLQVSSVFDDDSDNSPVSDDNNKVQTWNSQYYRGEPMVVVARESSVLEEQHSSSSTVMSGSQTIGNHLLLPPVRSSRNGVSEQDASPISRTNSRSNSMRFSGVTRNGDLWGASSEGLEGKVEEDVVFRSPIPWRSRSARMEVKEEDLDGAPLYQPWKPSRKNMSACSASLTSELQAKSVEDVVKKKPSYKSSSFQSIPPPPPPPPPPHRTSSANYTRTRSNNPFVGKELRRSVTSFETEDFPSRGELDSGFRTRSASALMGKSVRTVMGKGSNVDEVDKDQMRNMDEENTRRNYEECDKKVVTETEDESEESDEDEDDRMEELPEKDEKVVKDVCSSDTGPDVDKKADEFIAKFREQIRLQRIASIRRSTGQAPKTSMR